MKTTYKILLLLLLSLTIITANSQPDNSLTPFASGFDDPVCITNSGDIRLFVVSRTGYIYIVDEAGNINAVPFLDIVARVKSTGGEQGLLGIAFHPEYPDSGYFYVNYTGTGDSTHISRFTVSQSNPDVADAGSEKNLLTIFQPFANHNGGDLCFGPDGYLYIGLGDGGSGGDPGNRAQNLEEFLGKILRIDVNHGNPYSIPETNPYYGNSSALEETWALGLRNPWRFSFDRLTGDLWIADVGQNTYEEIDFQPASSLGGENYGWRCYQGNSSYNSDGCGAAGLYTFPIHQYSHSFGCSVTGGYVYRGTQFPGMYGYYFFTDYCSDQIWTIHNDDGLWVVEEFGQFPGNSFTTFGEDVNGMLYVAGYSNGTIYRIGDNSSGFFLDLHVFLEGPFFGSQMTTDLNTSGNIPLAQPYNAAPWNYTGNEAVTYIPKNNIADWVLVELRDAPDAGSATSATRIARQAAFLLSDGNIVGLDGLSILKFDISIIQQLFVIIWHRNHLGIMSAYPLTSSNNVYSYDFAGSSGQIYGDLSGHKEIAPNIWGMISGDSDGNGLINNADKTGTWNAEAGQSGYIISDFNFEDEVNNSDKNDFLIPNYLKGSQVPD
jgi:glucose/arabinose dehydrogenase